MNRDKRQELGDLLEETRRQYPANLLHEIAISCASFIAAIDSDSNAVAAYLENRFKPLVSLALSNHGVIQALKQIHQ